MNLFFTLIGGAMLGFFIWVWRSAREKDVLRKRFPDQPWRWVASPKTPNGSFHARTQTYPLISFVVGIVVMIIVTTLIIGSLGESHPWMALLSALAFLLIMGSALLRQTIGAWRADRLFRKAILRARFPAVLGTEWTGCIELPRLRTGADSSMRKVELIVQCRKQFQSDSETHLTDVIYESRTTASVQPSPFSYQHESQIPFSFHLPPNGSATDDNRSISWRLGIRLVGDSHWSVFYEIPVAPPNAAISGSAQDTHEVGTRPQGMVCENHDDGGRPRPGADPANREVLSRETSLVIQTRREGGHRLTIPPILGRHVLLAHGIILGWLAWLVQGTLHGANWGLVAIVGVISLILGCCLVNFWLGVSRLETAKGLLRIGFRRILPHRWIVLRCHEIKRFEMTLEGSTGNEPRYKISVEDCREHTTTLMHGIRSHYLAEQLIALIKADLDPATARLSEPEKVCAGMTH